MADGAPVRGEGADGRRSSWLGDAMFTGDGKLGLLSFKTGRIIVGNSGPSRGGNFSFLGSAGFAASGFW